MFLFPINILIIINTFIFLHLIVVRKNFISRIIIIFSGVYYIFPPLTYLLYVDIFDYRNISNEILFTRNSIRSESFLILLMLTFIYLICLYLLPKYEKKMTQLNIQIKHRIIFYILSVFLIILNYLYFEEAGGIVAFYSSHWAERFKNSGGLKLLLILNFKIILPFVLLFMGTYIKNTKNKHLVNFILFLAFISFIIGGSGRKFAVLFIFGVFIINVSYNGKKKIFKLFYH